MKDSGISVKPEFSPFKTAAVNSNNVINGKGKMNSINFYHKKYAALETFYGWVDQGSEYDIAVEQSIYYNHWAEEIDEIILNITIATRYARCDKTISKTFKKRLEDIIPKAKMLNLQDYGLTDEEIKVFNEEIEEVEALILMV